MALGSTQPRSFNKKQKQTGVFPEQDGILEETNSIEQANAVQPKKQSQAAYIVCEVPPDLFAVYVFRNEMHGERFDRGGDRAI